MQPIVTDQVAWSVGLSVCLTVGLSVTLVSSAKTAAPIEMTFGLRTRVGPESHELDGRPDPPWQGQFLGRASHCKVQGHSAVIFAKTAKLIDMPFGLWAWMGHSNHVVDGGSKGADGRCRGNQFWDAVCYNWLSVGYNFGCMIASDTLFDSRAGFSGVKLSNEDIADFNVFLAFCRPM